MPLRTYALQGTTWVPLDGSGGTVGPGPGPEEPNPQDSSDFRVNDLMLPPAGKVVFGFSPSSGTLTQIESLWGKQSRIVRVYGGTLANLTSIMGTCQDYLNTGRVPSLDFNTSAQYAYAGFNVSNINGTGKTLWQAQADGFFDSDGVGPNGRAYKGLRSMLLGVKNLTSGSCPTNRIFLSKDHEMEDMNEGGGDGKVNGEANKVSSGTVTEFRAAWKHMWNLSKSLQANNILWFMDGASGVSRWGENQTDEGSDGFYPGHKYVDIVAWDPYNAAGLRGNEWKEFPGILNKFKQLDWWNRNYKVGGAKTLAEATGNQGVYKPIMLAEFGTVDSFTLNGTTYTAAQWPQGMIDYLSIEANSARFKWLLYFNNSNMTILNQGSFRRAAFANKGTNAIWG